MVSKLSSMNRTVFFFPSVLLEFFFKALYKLELLFEFSVVGILDLFETLSLELDGLLVELALLGKFLFKTIESNALRFFFFGIVFSKEFYFSS